MCRLPLGTHHQHQHGRRRRHQHGEKDKREKQFRHHSHPHFSFIIFQGRGDVNINEALVCHCERSPHVIASVHPMSLRALAKQSVDSKTS